MRYADKYNFWNNARITIEFTLWYLDLFLFYYKISVQCFDKQSWWTVQFFICHDDWSFSCRPLVYYIRLLFFICEMLLKFIVPSVHSVDLISVDSLTRTVSKISLSPFSESSGDLFDTNLWIISVVSISCSEKFVKWDQITSFSF